MNYPFFFFVKRELKVLGLTRFSSVTIFTQNPCSLHGQVLNCRAHCRCSRIKFFKKCLEKFKGEKSTEAINHKGLAWSSKSKRWTWIRKVWIECHVLTAQGVTAIRDRLWSHPWDTEHVWSHSKGSCLLPQSCKELSKFGAKFLLKTDLQVGVRLWHSDFSKGTEEEGNRVCKSTQISWAPLGSCTMGQGNLPTNVQFCFCSLQLRHHLIIC